MMTLAPVMNPEMTAWDRKLVIQLRAWSQQNLRVSEVTGAWDRKLVIQLRAGWIEEGSQVSRIE